MFRLTSAPSVALICCALIATPLMAHEGVKDPQVMARMHNMGTIQKAFKTLVGMAKNETPLHQAKARMARDSIVSHATQITTLFEPQATDPKSEALPAIWANWEDFTARADDLTTTAQALSFKDRAALADTLGALGGACRACHKSYRAKTP